MIGKTISHYKILEKLGEGGMGVVFKAHDIKLDRDVALKFLPPHLTFNETEKKRFLLEARAAARLNHPNICMVFEVDEFDGQYFIAMELVEGQNLKEMIKRGPLEIKEGLDIAVQIAEGLQKAHDKGIIHRDIKSANIMLNDEGIVKIMDFGLAKLAGQAGLTKTRSTAGTVAYMSPEQIQGQEIDARSDIWSFGIVLYEMLTGKLPFKGEYESAMMYSILNEEPEKLSDLKKEIPAKLEGFVNNLLIKNWNERYQNLSEIIDDLREVKDGLEVKIEIPEKEKSPSIAVLPFVDMSPKKDQEYFCDGMAEEIINALTQLKELRVVARTSAFSFRGKEIDIREIGSRINVDYILEGSVRKSDNRLRITAQLIQISDGYHLWSERYDRMMEDIFAIQDEITISIVDKLKLNLFGIQKNELVMHHTGDKEAYNLYLKGRFYFNKNTDEWLLKAIKCFEEAVEKDSDFALAYAGIAETYVMLYVGLGSYPGKDTILNAKAAVNRAFKLAPNLAEAHMVRALLATYYDWDFDTAESEYEHAIRLNPNSIEARWWYAFFIASLKPKYYQKALLHLDYAEEIDPLHLLVKHQRVVVYYFLRDFDTAIKHQRAILDIEPQFALEHYILGCTYAHKGMYKEAITHLNEAIKLGGRSVNHLGMLGFTYGLAGFKDKARELLLELLERSKKGVVSSSWLSVIYIGLGDNEQVFRCLEKAYEERDGALLFLLMAPEFDLVKDDPRYNTFLKKMDLN
jgi:serine/threonine protein kinase